MHGTCIKIRDSLYLIDPHAYVVVHSKGICFTRNCNYWEPVLLFWFNILPQRLMSLWSCVHKEKFQILA